MRDDKLVSPVISTYAIGGDAPSPRRSAGLALPVIVILGTASVAAIVSVSFEGETPIVADQRSTEVVPSPRSATVTQAADEPQPSVTVRLNAPLAAPADAPVVSAGEARSRDLPMLSVLQPRAATASSPRPTAVAASPSARKSSRPAQPAIRRDDAAVPAAAAECEGDCVEGDSFQAAFGPASGAVNLDAGLSAANAPLAADDAIGGLPGVKEAPAADAAMATAEPPATTGLVADSGPAMLAEPEEGLVADGPDLAMTGETAPATQAALVPVEPGGVAEPGTVELQPASSAEATAASAADAAAASTIPQHIARIGERYAGVPAAEPAVRVRSATERPAAESDQPALVESTVAVDLRETAGPGVIVQDDELVAIRLGELVSLLEDRLDHPLYVWLSSSSAASKFVTAQTLAAAGIRTRYDAERRQLVISTSGD